MGLASTCTILFIFLCLCSCVAATEIFAYLTQETHVENGSYYLHYVNVTNDKPQWISLPVPNYIHNIEDVEFNYLTNVFYFSSSQTGNKGIWKGPLTLQNVYKSHQLREETTPMTIRSYPGYEVAFVYDAGYQSILAISLRNEKEDLRIKSLFDRVEGLDGTFFLDTVKNRLIAENGSYTIFTSALNGSAFRSEFNLQSQYTKGTKLLAYDNDDTTLHYCYNSALLGMKMDGHDPFTAPNVPCAPLVASKGVLYYTNTSTACVMKLSYNLTGVTVQKESYLHLPFNVSGSRIISFKRYQYEDTTGGLCNTLSCNHICVPQDASGKPVCACTDYYVSYTYPNSTSVCQKETLHSPGLIYAVSLVPNNTLFYRLEGDPAEWIRRPQREQLFTIRSGIVGLAVDWDQQRLLIAETQFRQIASAKMDGTFGTLAHYAGLSVGVKSIAYDWIGGNAVWFDPVFKWLRIVPLTDYNSMLLHRSADALSSIFQMSSTSIYKTSLAATELEGYSLSLDANVGFLFFLDRDDQSGEIHAWRALMDGSNATKLYTFPPFVFDINLPDENPDFPLPGSLTVDFSKQRLWVAFPQNVFVLDYNGTEVKQFHLSAGTFTVANSHVASVQIYQSKFLFVAITSIQTRQSLMFVYQVGLKPSGDCCLGLTQVHNRTFNGEFRAMTAYQETPAVTDKLNCSLANCQFMCTNINGSATCICPDGYAWNATTKECTVDQTLPSSPVVVYNTQEKICYRSLDTVGQPTTSLGPSLFDADYCLSNGKKVYSIIEPDHFTYKIYAVQQNHMPAAIYNLRLRAASRLLEWISLPLGILTDTAADDSEVFYSGNTVVALAFDWLGRNLYIADQSSRSLVVLRDNYYYPTLIQEDVNITALVVDALRRKLYWATFTNTTNTSTIVQRNLDASGECILGTIQGSVVQMQISYSNSTLLFLEQPSNRLGLFVLRSLPPFSSCQQPTIQYIQFSVANVSQFVVYQRLTMFASATSVDLTLYVSTTMGATYDSTITLKKSALQPSPSGMRGPIKSLAVINPYLFSDADNTTNPSNLAYQDKCADIDHGRCEHLCLASWSGVNSSSHCACTDGMVLLADQRHCAPRPIDLFNEGGIISVDDYHHKIFMLPLKTLMDGKMSFSVQQNLSALFIHAKARPYSVAFDSVTSEIYFGDHERGAIVRVNPQVQMTRDPNQGNMEEMVVHLGNKVYGLFIDPDSRLLFYTHREGHYLAVWDMEQKTSAQIYTADQYTSIYGVVMDRRPDRMHIYVATRNVTTVTVGPTSGGPGSVPSSAQPSTWSAIVRCFPNGANCTTVVNFTARGAEKTKTVPWIYELSIDYIADRLYFSTGQNRSIMYLDLKNTSASPQIFATEGAERDPSFIYGVQVYGDYLLATDWQHRGIHVFDIRTQQKKGVIGGSFFTGLNGIVVFSRDHEDGANFSQVCAHTLENKYCSHICVPMPNNKRACKCPMGGDPVDGVNCKDIIACPRPDHIFGSFDDECNLRPNSSCTFTCATGPQIQPGFAGIVTPKMNCIYVQGVPQWSQSIESLCRLVPTTVKSTTESSTAIVPGKPTDRSQSTTTSKTTPRKKPSTSAKPSSTTTLRTFAFTTVGAALNKNSGQTADNAGGATSQAGIIIAVVVIVIMLIGTVVGIFVYFRRRPNARGFRRLDDAPGAGNLITGSAAVASGVPPGTVAFRNPMFGMEDIDNVTVIDPRTQQPPQQTSSSSQQSSGGFQSSQGPREGQVVIF